MTSMPTGPLRSPPHRALLAAACLVMSCAVPAVAQPSLEFNIGASTPRAADSVGEFAPPDTPPAMAERSDPAEKPGCLSNRELRRGLRGHDFDNIEIGRPIGPDVFEVHANYGGSLYRMALDRCSGKVSDVKKVGRNRIGGFGLQFGY